MPTRILYLSYDGLTDPLGQSQILPYLTGLAKRGFFFTVISFEKKHALQKNRDSVSAVCSESKIKWIACDYHKRPPIISTLIDLWILWREVKKAVAENGIEIVHCRSYITSLVGLRAKNRWGLKFIFDMRGFWADERVEGGLWGLKNPLYRLVYDFFKGKEKQFLEEADHIISLTHNAKKEIESWRNKNGPITVIPTCVDLDLFDPEKIKKEDQTHLRKSLDISENDFVLLYLGSWGTWYLTEKMLDFFSRLKTTVLNAKFLIVSPDKINLEGYPYKKDVIVTSASRARVPIHISLADLSICFIKPSFSKKASSATKLGEIMAMGLPVVVNGDWGDVDLFTQAETGVLKVDLQNMEVPELSAVKRQSNIRAFAKNYFSLAEAIEAYNKIYKSLKDA